MSKKLGLIAEDDSDIKVIKEILLKLFDAGEYSTKRHIGHGCGNIKSKCNAWTQDLLDRECDYIFIFHDLDRNDAKELRRSLENEVYPTAKRNSLIVIPVQEIEAWLLSDKNAIKRVFKLTSLPNIPSDVEAIEFPKEYLKKIIWQYGKKRYEHRIHNQEIAKESDIKSFKECDSFKYFSDHIEKKVRAQ